MKMYCSQYIIFCDLKHFDKNDGDGQDVMCMTVTITVERFSRYYFSGNQSIYNLRHNLEREPSQKVTGQDEG